MLPKASFFIDIMAPSQRLNVSRAISRGVRWSCPGSRTLMNQAFSAKRAASRKSGMPWPANSSRSARMLVSETGWPPPELLVTVSTTSGTRPAFSPSHPPRRSMSILPLKGWSHVGSSPSGITKSSASAPEASILARVVSKWVFPGIASPSPPTSPKRMRSAARPWCTGMMWRRPVMSRTAFS